MAKTIPDDIYTPQTQNPNGVEKVLIITADDTEDLEFFYPYYRFIEAGFTVDVATPKGGECKGKHGLPIKETLKIEAVNAENYDFLYIPGGKAPAKLRKLEEALAITRRFAQSGKPIVAICHGPQLLAEADIIRGRKIAAWPEVEKEVTDAGATYVNQEAVVDGQFITGRWPADLPALMASTFDVVDHKAERIPPADWHTQKTDWRAI